ncbi:MAG TPA: Uma2 family endonuclease [Humisphaera sp.]|jgi:hypothetical protein|nr:Uma2 family endonuclease [Humisphaera sp.]
MVASTANFSAPPKTAEPARYPLFGRSEIVLYTVDDVLKMVSLGIIPEDSTTELLDGVVVFKDRSDLGGDPRVHGKQHRLCVNLLTALVPRIANERRHVQIQLPLVCGEMHMPEPDFAIIRGSARDYADRFPTAADALVVIEVADSSLPRDSNRKLEIYAAANIPQYLLINLRNLTIEHYADPDAASSAYRSKSTFTREQSLMLNGGTDGENISVLAAEMLP